MSLAAPFWLLLALSGLGVLYLHASRRTTVIVPSLMIWQRVASGRATKRPLRPPPWSLALALQLAVVAGLALALAEPMFGPRLVTHRILVVDATALPETVEAARRQVAAAATDADHPVSVVAAGPAPRVVGARLTDLGAVEAALGWIAPQDGAVDRDGTDRLLKTLRRDGETSAVAWVRGTQKPAIAARIVREGDGWRVTGTVRQAAGVEMPASAKVLFMPEGPPGFLDWADIPLSFKDGVAAFSTKLELSGSGVVAVQLPGGGIGVRYVVRTEPQATRVLYLGEPTPAVVRALQAVPGTSLFQADSLPASEADFDLVVVDGTTVPRRPATNVLWLGSAHVDGEPMPLPVEAVAATQWLETHALSRGMDWTGLTNFRGFAAPARPGGEVVLAVARSPLVEARTTGNGRDVRIGIDLRNTSWVDDPSYVALMANLLHWAGLARGAGVEPACVTGMVCQVPARLLTGSVRRVAEAVLAQADEDARPLLPAKAVSEDADKWLAPGMDRAFVPETAGLYRIVTPEGLQALVAVNAAADADRDGGQADTGIAAPQTRTISVWWALLGLTLVLMAGEFAMASLRGERLAVARTHPRWLQNRVTFGVTGLALVFVLAALAGLPIPQLSGGRAVIVAATPERAAQVRGEFGEADTVAMGTDDRPGGNVGEALMMAAATVPAGHQGRIVLDWNGNETTGNLPVALEVLARRGIPVDVRPRSPAPGVSVEGISGPDRVFVGDAFTLNAMVHSWMAQPQSIEILRDGKVIATQETQLAAGVNRIEAVVRADVAGQQFYAVRLAGSNAPAAQAGEWIEAAAAPKVAVLAGQGEAAQAFATALGLQGLTVTTLPPDRAPATLAAWLDYDAVVMMDVPATALASRQLEQLETAVRDHGRALLILGGPNAFGPGGFYETPLEALSPLSSRVPRNAPKTGFVFVLDRSGSMQRDEGGLDRLTIAKAATLNATGLLNPKSQVGIVAFDTSAHTVLPLQEAGDENAMRQALSKLGAEGGTAVYPALADAVEMLRTVDLPKRHIVVISDGLTQPGDFPGLLAEARAAGITVSAIAIGDAADPTSLADIAGLGGGAFHWSRDFRALPGILAQETLLSSTSPIKERAVVPEWVDRSDAFLSAAPETVPAINGYVETTAKPRAHLHLATYDEDGNAVPIMASWRYGAGQVLALATQATGRWTEAWNAQADYPRFWSQIVRGLAPAPGLGLEVTRAGDELVVRVKAAEEPAVTYAGPETGSVRLAEFADGRWEGRFPVASDGDYVVTAVAGGTRAEARAHVSYGAALSRLGADDSKRQSIARITGGAMLGDVPGERPPASWTLASGWRLWALLAAACFLASLALRYLPGLFGNRIQTQTNAAPPLRRAA